MLSLTNPYFMALLFLIAIVTSSIGINNLQRDLGLKWYQFNIKNFDSNREKIEGGALLTELIISVISFLLCIRYIMKKK